VGVVIFIPLLAKILLKISKGSLKLWGNVKLKALMSKQELFVGVRHFYTNIGEDLI